MTSFSDLGLSEPVLHALKAEGYATPTPIQAQTVPVMLQGRDVLGTAQTGTGKTAAFLLPILHRIAETTNLPKPGTCRALVLAPTRELAAQIADSVRRYGRSIRPATVLVVGGAKPGPQRRGLARGADIVVATPGRLLDHMQSRAISLDETQTFVLDEADQMLDLGFLPPIRKILTALPKDRQSVLLSATMPKPIRALAHEMLREPAQISVARVSRPAERIDQRIEFVERSEKRTALTKLLKGTPIERAIVFTRTKRGADRVCRHLSQAGLKAGAIHGDKTQGQRERALESFRKGRTPILVATDIAARGIDVDGISHVINFELPNVPEVYVHRIGRTARAGESGIAISLCDREERAFLRDIERLIGQRLSSGAEEEKRPASKAKPKPKAPRSEPDKRPQAARKAPRQGGKPRRPAGGRGGGAPLKRRKGPNTSSGGSPRSARKADAASVV